MFFVLACRISQTRKQAPRLLDNAFIIVFHSKFGYTGLKLSHRDILIFCLLIQDEKFEKSDNLPTVPL